MQVAKLILVAVAVLFCTLPLGDASAQVTSGTTVYKCRLGKRPPECERVAGQLPLSQFQSDVEALLALPLEAITQGHGRTAKCRVIGTGPNSVYIVCGEG